VAEGGVKSTMDDLALTRAVNKLLSVATGDTGGSRRVAQFLLSLWNGEQYRADLQAVMYIEDELFSDMVSLWSHLHTNNLQLESIVSDRQMAPVIAQWGSAVKISQ
jgi:hypothetical protein